MNLNWKRKLSTEVKYRAENGDNLAKAGDNPTWFPDKKKWHVIQDFIKLCLSPEMNHDVTYQIKTNEKDDKRNIPFL